MDLEHERTIIRAILMIQNDDSSVNNLDFQLPRIIHLVDTMEKKKSRKQK